MNSIDRYRRLLAYETESNRRVLESLATVPDERRATPQYQRATQLLPHNLLARKVWLHRIKGTTYENPKDWFPAMSIERTRTEAAEVDRLWAAYLATLTEEELAREVKYASSEGVRYASSVDDILTHVFNHSTYHRGQIARLVNECGGKRASTDFIAVTRRTL